MQSYSFGRVRRLHAAATRCALLCLVIVAFLPALSLATSDATLGVYFDPEGTICHGSIHPGQPGTIYIISRSTPGTNFAAGAEFRFTGVPASWSLYPVPNPDIINFGDPFGAGTALGYTCNPEQSTVILYTVLVIAGSEEEDVRFELVQRDPPTNRSFPCPLVVDCSFELHCVEPSPCFVNASTAAPCDSPTAVEKATWSRVRELFR